MPYTITTKEAPECLVEVMTAGLTPMLVSSPGCGKSAIAAQIAKKNNLKLIDIRLAQCDPCDLNGFPSINKDGTKAGYLPMDTFPLASDPVPKGYDGWLILFDEMNSAPMMVQASAYKIILDRMVGQQKLHKNVWMMAAGNLATDKAIVNRMSTAMQSRMIHFQLELNPKDWIEWFDENGGDYRISAFINFLPDSLQVFTPDHDDKTFACPRTWSFLSSMSKSWDKITLANMPIVAGTIGEAMAREFIGFCTSSFTLTIEQIIASPQIVKIPDEPSTKWAISKLLSHHLNETNVDPLMEFIERLPVEFQIITVKAAMRRSRTALRGSDTFKQWAMRTGAELLVDD